MRYISTRVLALTLSLVVGSNVLASDAPLPAEDRFVEVNMSFESEGQLAEHRALAKTGDYIHTAFTQADKQVKISYVVNYDAKGAGHIKTEVQTASANTDDWTRIANSDFSFIDGGEIFSSRSSSDGQNFTMVFTVQERISPDLAQQ